MKMTTNKADMLLDYFTTYLDTKLRFFAGSMILMAYSDAACLVVPGAKDR